MLHRQSPACRLLAGHGCSRNEPPLIWLVSAGHLLSARNVTDVNHVGVLVRDQLRQLHRRVG